MKVIGLTGLNAAGKTTFGQLLEESGYKFFSLSDILRDILKERGVEENRKNLIKVGNEMREEHGAGALGVKMVEKLQSMGHDKFVIDSIRNPAEIEELKKLADFTLLVLEADARIRYERAMVRGRLEGTRNFDDFIKQENLEKSTNAKGQQLHKCIELAETKINNDGSMDDLEKVAKDYN